MKITNADFLDLKTKLNATLDKVGREKTIEAYESGNFPRSEFVKDLQTRFCFDVYHACYRENDGLMDKLYAYLNDDHIYTALKAILPAITRKY